MKTTTSKEEFNNIIKCNFGALFYFSTISCSVGEALEPKVIELLNKEFPKIPCFHVDMNALPELSTKNNVFVEPTILIFFDGKETIRRSRNISVKELSISISRLYKIAFQ